MINGVIYNISYEIAGLIILGIIIFVLYTIYDIKTRTNKRFKYMVFTVFAAELLDTITAITISFATVVPIWLNYLLNGLYMVSCAATMYMAFRYVITSIRKFYKTLTIINIVVLGAYALINATNFLTDWVFSFRNLSYDHGPLYYLTYVILFAYLIEIIVIIIINRKNFKRYQLIANVIFPSIIVIVTILQIVLPGKVLLTLFGSSCAILVMLFSLETPDYQQLEFLQKNLEIQVKFKTEESEKRRKQVEILTEQTIVTLARSIDALDGYTNGHSIRVAKYSKMIAERYGLKPDDIEHIEYAALLHDIGKISINRLIIRKEAKLNDEEWAEIKKHPAVGGEILKGITLIPEISSGAHWHHERYDGHGYPDGLKGNDIPLFARIISVADAYDAMSSRRSYRNLLPQEAVLKELRKGLGTQWDPEFAKIMIDIIKEDKDYELREIIEEEKND